MIRDIADALQARLREKGCPIPVVTSAEPSKTNTGGRERIVVEHDYDGNDAYSGPKSQHGNPKHVMTRTVAAKLTVYAQSVKAGAQLFEHHRRAEQILDVVLASMDLVTRDDLQVAWRPTGGRFIRPEDLETSAKLPGVVYELTFTADRAVTQVTWRGDAAPEVTLPAGSVASTTRVQFANGEAPAETGCGGT